MKIGYARVSTTDQYLETQLEELQKSGCEEIFQEKRSGADSDREELAAALRMIRKKDIFIVTKLDLVSRSMVDFWNIVKRLRTKAHQCRCLT